MENRWNESFEEKTCLSFSFLGKIRRKVARKTLLHLRIPRKLTGKKVLRSFSFDRMENCQKLTDAWTKEIRCLVVIFVVALSFLFRSTFCVPTLKRCVPLHTQNRSMQFCCCVVYALKCMDEFFYFSDANTNTMHEERKPHPLAIGLVGSICKLEKGSKSITLRYGGRFFAALLHFTVEKRRK